MSTSGTETGAAPNGAEPTPLAHRLVWVLLVLFVCGLVGAAAWKRSRQVPAPAVKGVLGGFALTDQSGTKRVLKDLDGQVWVAGFVFTRCGGTCPMIVRAMTGLTPALSRHPDLRLVCFSMDPAFDTPEVLSAYAKAQGAVHPNWLFLTGAPAEIERVTVQEFKLGLAEGLSAEEPILHSPKLVLVDRKGAIRGYYDGITPEGFEELSRDLEALLAEGRGGVRR